MPTDRETDRIFEEAVLRKPVSDKDAPRAPGPVRPVDKKRRIDHNHGTLDLHGLTLEKALDAAGRAVRETRRNGGGPLKIVTGRGLNSPGLHSPLALGVEEFLERQSVSGNLTYEKKEGYFLVWLKKSSSSR